MFAGTNSYHFHSKNHRMTTPRPHLYSRVLKTKTSWFTQIDAQYVLLGSNKAKAEH
jgi:hypothetical protein